MQIRCGWCSYCSSFWKFDIQCFPEAHLLYYSTSVYKYVDTFVQVTNWTLSQVIAACSSYHCHSSSPYHFHQQLPIFNTQIVCYKGGHCGICQHPRWLSPFFTSLCIHHLLWSSGLLRLYSPPWPLYPVWNPWRTPILLSQWTSGLHCNQLQKDFMAWAYFQAQQHCRWSSRLSTLFFFQIPHFPLEFTGFHRRITSKSWQVQTYYCLLGAIIACLVIAHKIIEQYFWPHLFQPVIDNPPALQRLRQPPSLVSPNTSWNKSPVFTSAFISPSHTNNTLHQPPHAPYCLLESQCLQVNKQSEHTQSTPSETDLTGGKEGSASFLRLDTMPTPFRLCTTPISLNHQPSITSLRSHFSTISEAGSDKAFAQSNHASTTQHSGSSTPPHAGGTQEPGNLKDNTKAGEVDKQVMGEIEVAAGGKGVMMVPCTHTPPIQLTTIQGNTTRGLTTVSTRTSSSLSILWPLSMSLRPPTVLQPPSTALGPTLTMPAPTTMSPPPMASQPMSTTWK